MSKRNPPPFVPSPALMPTLVPPPMMLMTMMMRLATASWGTIMHRSMMMAQGTCSAAEYQRMFTEKIVATQLSAAAMIAGRGHVAALQPFVSRARANHRRLGRKA